MINLINQRCEINQELQSYPTANLTLSILGTQGSGKSTLLNHVFQSNFPTLQASVQRTRCTTGVWLHHLPNFNIIDTEGFDSMQRGDDEKIFEKQMSLFCVVVSDIILINLYMDQIGRYTGGHMDILEAIFKVGERLVTPHKKKIIYIIRDCTQDADKNILSSQLSQQIKTLSKQYNNKQLKYSIQFYFMSHFIYQPQMFIQQAKKLLPKINIQRASTINNYKQGDRVRYLNELWKLIKDSKTQLDLKSIDDALKNYVMQRLKQQVTDILTQSLDSLVNLNQVKTYERYNLVLNRIILQYFSEHRPKHIKEKELQLLASKFFQQFEPTSSKHFNTIALKKIQQELEQMLESQISKNRLNKKLSNLIFKKKKEVIETYKKVIEQHQEYQLLLKNFNQKMSNIINREENRLNHLFSLFQVTVQRELNIIVGRQAANLIFVEKEIKDKIKALCQQYHYQEWEVDFTAIWDKVSFRCLEKIVPESIQSKSKEMISSGSFISSDQTTSIIALHTKLEKKALDFGRQILFFMNQENMLTQPLSEIKDIVRQCLNQRLNEEKRRWKISLLIVSFLLFLLYGELSILISSTSLKKKQKRMYLRFYYWATFAFFLYCAGKELLAHRKRVFG